MKFIQKLLGCCRNRKDTLKKMKDQIAPGKNPFAKSRQSDTEQTMVSFDGSSIQNPGMPRWVEMKCNALVYLKQAMKHNRKRKMEKVKSQDSEKEKFKEDKTEEKDNNDAQKAPEGNKEEIKGEYKLVFIPLNIHRNLILVYLLYFYSSKYKLLLP